ncbi:hypothetical protein B9Z19DRAFT_1130189 [Tuber borchii]|uniref:Uncharacterized protein n=1 Tax=Tuber borchii TaxID=42251 RepID=A0A2T6ZKX1_TUBBO|nr:hypothetical protein B9Z19DRAFT_1130189 [Tuber borchii]
MPTRGEDRTSEYQLTAKDMDRVLDMTVREDELDEMGRPLIVWVKPVEWLLPHGEGEEMIYEEEEEEEEEMDDDGYDNNDDDYHNNAEREQSSDSLSGSGNGDFEMIVVSETSGSSLGRVRWDLDDSHSAPSTCGLYSDAAETRFRTSTPEIRERLLRRAMTSKDFFTSSEDQQDCIEYIITKRKWLFAGNAHLIIDLEAAGRKHAEEQGIDLEEMDRIDREMHRQALLHLSRQQLPYPITKEPAH